jgi:hypothetical protein
MTHFLFLDCPSEPFPLVGGGTAEELGSVVEGFEGLLGVVVMAGDELDGDNAGFSVGNVEDVFEGVRGVPTPAGAVGDGASAAEWEVIAGVVAHRTRAASVGFVGEEGGCCCVVAAGGGLTTGAGTDAGLTDSGCCSFCDGWAGEAADSSTKRSAYLLVVARLSLGTSSSSGTRG